ncbi:hypothetical protein HHI36_004280 [Cryptolaemus montrouzieri]|uniref:Uncharacterized protein n=1 Tax=Cryptolaemus montrouzieri TaxID=559131 RepID=A0ABD2NQR0_9CUCU
MGRKHKQKFKNTLDKLNENNATAPCEVSEQTKEELLELLKKETSHKDQEIQVELHGKKGRKVLFRRLKVPSKSWFFENPQQFDSAVKNFGDKFEIYDDMARIFGYYADINAIRSSPKFFSR